MRRVLLILIAASTLAFAGHGENTEPAIGWKWANFGLLVLGFGYMIGKHAPAFFKGQDETIQHDLGEAAEMKASAAHASTGTQHDCRLGRGCSPQRVRSARHRTCHLPARKTYDSPFPVKFDVTPIT